MTLRSSSPVDPELSLRRFVFAAIVSAAVILTAPFIGEVRNALRSAFPVRFAGIINTGIISVVGVAFAVALARMRHRRLLRLFAIVAALAVGATYALLTKTGSPEVDAVERFHFVEYGIVTLMFYRAWRPLGDASIFVLPALAAFLVGTLDEGLQWFVPARVGEVRDVFLNSAAIACGLVASVGLDPPGKSSIVLRPRSLERIGLLTAADVLALALFVHAAHLGYTIRDPDIGLFASRYMREELERLSSQRAEQWRVKSPLPQPLLAREDQYLSEALAHVRERNVADPLGAWRENRILEKFFGPVLDIQSRGRYDFRWSVEQRAEASERAKTDSRPYVSPALPIPMYSWPKLVYWAMVASLVGAIVGSCLFLERQRHQQATAKS